MNVQMNHFGSVYGKMGLTQKRRYSQTPMLSYKSDNVPETEQQPAKTRGTVSPYDVYARMRKIDANLSSVSLSA